MLNIQVESIEPNDLNYLLSRKPYFQAHNDRSNFQSSAAVQYGITGERHWNYVLVTK